MEKPNVRITVAIILITFYLLAGTIFFHLVERWRFIDAFYYTGITLTTVGYGDFTPTKDISKLITVFLAFSGVGIIFYSVAVIAQNYFERQEKRLRALKERHKGHNHFKVLWGPFEFLKRKFSYIK